MVWLTAYRADAQAHAALIEDARGRTASGLEFLERGLGGKTWLVGEQFTAADVMMGFTLVAARLLGVLDARFPRLQAYVSRLEARPTFQKAIAV